jgi:hypothetical protein
MGALQLVTALLRQLLQSRAALVAENFALRHQIVILQRSVKHPRLHRETGSSGSGFPACGEAGGRACSSSSPRR